jgi:hypothetical protein
MDPSQSEVSVEELLLPEIAPADEAILPEPATTVAEPVVEEVIPVITDKNPTIEYDLAELIAIGEMDAHTANDLVEAAKQILGLTEPEETAEPVSSEPEPVDEPTVIIPVIDPTANESAKEETN